jgi:glycosyltransferase involved in cell wall biosynthesis
VLVVACAYPDEVRPYYGAYVHSEVQAQRRAGLQVDVLAVRGYAGKHHYVMGGLRVMALNLRDRYDVVHSYYGLMGVVARLQLRAPLVVSYTGGDIQGDHDSSGRLTRSSTIMARVFLAAAHFADATTTQTTAMEKLLPSSCHARNHVIPTGVELARFGLLSRAEARARLGWAPDKPTVIFVADPRRRVKNFPLARAAVESLRERLPAVRLHVADKVPLTEIPMWMAAADALILTSHAEGSPNVVKEAMAAELPVVTTPVGDVPERFRGVPGCYVRPPEPEALAAALADAIAHGRTPAARQAIAHLDVRSTAERIIDVYESVANRR